MDTTNNPTTDSGAEDTSKPQETASEVYTEILKVIEELKSLSTMYIAMHHSLRADYDLLEQDRDNWKQKYQELYAQTTKS